MDIDEYVQEINKLGKQDPTMRGLLRKLNRMRPRRSRRITANDVLIRRQVLACREELEDVDGYDRAVWIHLRTLNGVGEPELEMIGRTSQLDPEPQTYYGSAIEDIYAAPSPAGLEYALIVVNDLEGATIQKFSFQGGYHIHWSNKISRYLE